jgi:RND family efflux transporter MFP subunit
MIVMKMLPVVPLVFTLLVLISGCKPAETAKPVSAKIRAVTVMTIHRQNLPTIVSAVGRLVPDREVLVPAQVSGIVQTHYVDVGQPVAAGAELVRLDAVDYQLALNEARANLMAAKARLDAARKSFERVKQLLPTKVITPELYDRSEADYKTSQATVNQLQAVVDIARRRYAKTRIEAPFEGYVTRRLAEVGQHFNAGDPLIQIADMKTMRVKIHLNERDYVDLDPSDAVTVHIEAFGEKTFSGIVDRIGIKADPRTNTFEVEVLVENPAHLLKAGLTARVTIVTDQIPDALMIPQSCVLYRGNRTELFVVSGDNRASLRVVKLGRVEGGQVNVIKGLMPGDRLVTSGGQYLKDGDPVIIEDAIEGRGA